MPSSAIVGKFVFVILLVILLAHGVLLNLGDILSCYVVVGLHILLWCGAPWELVLADLRFPLVLLQCEVQNKTSCKMQKKSPMTRSLPVTGQRSY